MRYNVSQVAPTDPALVCRVEFLLKRDRRISLERAADMSIVTRQTAQHVICDVLGLKKVTERWVSCLELLQVGHRTMGQLL